MHPFVPITEYVDGFGNICHVIRAPQGRLTLSSDFLINDSGEPDAVAPLAPQLSLDTLPVDTLVYLLGSRYCETDRLSDIAWSRFGKVRKGWGLVQAICDFVNEHVTFGYEHAHVGRTAYDTYIEKRGVCRDFAHLAVTLCRCMNIPARYCTGYLGDIGVPADPCPMDFSAWFEVLSRRQLVHVRCAPQHSAHRPHPDRARARCHRCRHHHLVWPAHARGDLRSSPTR